MDFNLTEERQMLQDTLRRYLREQYGTARRNDILASETGFSPDIWTELADLGVLGALFTEDMGGFGGAGFDIAVVFEELGRAGVVEPFLDTAVLAGGLVADLGNDSARTWAQLDHVAVFRVGQPMGQHFQRGRGGQTELQALVIGTHMPFCPATPLAGELADRQRVEEFIGDKEQGGFGQGCGAAMPSDGDASQRLALNVA